MFVFNVHIVLRTLSIMVVIYPFSVRTAFKTVKYYYILYHICSYAQIVCLAVFYSVNTFIHPYLFCRQVFTAGEGGRILLRLCSTLLILEFIGSV